MFEFLTTPLIPEVIYDFELQVEYWIYIAAGALLLLELGRYIWRKTISWKLVGDTVTNFITTVASFGITIFLLGAFYLAAYYTASEFAIFPIETNLITVFICIILADLAYYWEHRFTHRVNLAWATHTVHHSSPHFNVSVAFRFGPMDGVWPIFFHIPLVFLGFHPLVVFMAEAFVLGYQTLLHTEVIRKLPRPIEAIFNTPSHHRAHHGANKEYIDCNYAGMLIIWDRWFGTFVEEKSVVEYGLTKQINSVNPFVVFFHGFTRLWRECAQSKGFGGLMRALFAPPGAPTDNNPLNKTGAENA